MNTAAEGGGEMNSDCCICLEPMFVSLGAEGTEGVMCVAGELFRCAQCHNSVHQKCIDESVVSSMEARCPLCRTPFQHPVLDIVRANHQDGFGHYGHVLGIVRMFLQHDRSNYDANMMRMHELPAELFGYYPEGDDEHGDEDEHELEMEPDDDE